MLTTIIILAATYGLVIGSFLNVVAIRMVKNESFVYPPSHCVHCNHRLGVLDLVPVFSYVFLRGKCRYCKQPISPIYPFGEAWTAIAFALMAWQWGASKELAAALLLVAILTVAMLTDLRAKIIPNKLVLFGIIAAAALRIWVHPLPLWNYAAAFFVGSGFLYLLAVATRGGMGGGDIKLYAFIGLILGIKLTLLSIFVASLLGSLYGLVLWIIRKYERGRGIAFGPFIACACFIVYIWGDEALNAYLNLYAG